MNVWTFYLMTSLIAVFINALYLLIVNTTEIFFSLGSSVEINLLLILLLSSLWHVTYL